MEIWEWEKPYLPRALPSGLGITEPVNSPTFTIVQQYEEGRLPLYHFDVYRIGDVEEMDEIGYEDCFYGEGVCLIRVVHADSGDSAGGRYSYYHRKGSGEGI